MANISASAQVAKGNAYGGMSGRSLKECLSAVSPNPAPASPFSFAPATAVIHWFDKNGSHQGNLAAMLAAMDAPSVFEISGALAGLTSISNLSVFPMLAALYVESNSLTTLDVSGNPQMHSMVASYNQLPVSVVNSVLESLNPSYGSGGTLVINNQGPSAPPTGAGLAAEAVLIASGWSVTTDGTVPFYFSPPSAIVSWSDTVGHSGNLSTFIQQATLANIVAFSAVGAGLANISSVSGFTNITGLDVSDNNLPVNVVNTILEQIAALGIIVGNYINVSGQNPPASPSGAEAQAAVLTLQAQGWSVTTD